MGCWVCGRQSVHYLGIRSTIVSSEGKLGKLGKFMMRHMGSKALTTLCLRPSRWVVKPS